MDIQINGNLKDISAMLVSSVRYALGRQTYIVDWTCEFISNNLHLILESDKKVMIRDIKEQEKYGYGQQIDKECWLKLLSILEKDLLEKGVEE